MLGICKQYIGLVDKEFQVMKFSLDNISSIELMDCSRDDLIEQRSSEKDNVESDCNCLGEEFSDLLLNSNFQLNEFEEIETTLSVEVSEEEPNKLNGIDLARNAIDTFMVLSETSGYIVFNHNSKKIASKSVSARTTYFADKEPVFLNKTIAKPLSSLIVRNNKIMVDYDIEDMHCFFEILNVGSEGITLSDFTISLPAEEFEKIKDKIICDNIQEANDSVQFKVLSTSLGKVNYEFSDYFVPISSVLCNRKRVLGGILESLKLIRNSKNVDNFFKTESFNRVGINNEVNGTFWTSLNESNSIFNIKYINEHKGEVREFLAMLEREPYDDFFDLDSVNNERDKLIAKNTYKLYSKSEKSELDEKIHKELLRVEFAILKVITEMIKIDKTSESLWIPTSYGQEIILLEKKEKEEE